MGQRGRAQRVAAITAGGFGSADYEKRAKDLDGEADDCDKQAKSCKDAEEAAELGRRANRLRDMARLSRDKAKVIASNLEDPAKPKRSSSSKG